MKKGVLKSVTTAAMSFKDIPAPNCHTGGSLSKMISNCRRSKKVNLKELIEKAKENSK